MTSASQVEHLHTTQIQPCGSAGLQDWLYLLSTRAWSGLKWVMRRAKAQHTRKNLRVCESVSLGDKRFVAVVQVDEERFLIGGSSGSVSLLTRLQETKTFAAALDREAQKNS